MPDQVSAHSYHPWVLWMVLLAIVLGGLVGFSFFGQMVGLFVPVFTLLLLLSLAFLAHRREGPRWSGNIWLVFPLLFFASMAAIRAAGFNVFLNLGLVLFLLVWLAQTAVGPDMQSLNFYDYFWQSFMSCIEITFPQPAETLAEAVKSIRANQPSLGKLLSLLRGLALALPVVIIFTMLLVSADPVFRGYVEDLLQFLHLDNLVELATRLVVSGLAFWFILGGLAYALRSQESELQPKAEEVVSQGWLGIIETAIILGSVDLLFAAFVTVQLRYFFGGNRNITLEGFTYAEYTRRGFAELVFVAIFSLGLALALQAWSQRRTPRARAGFEFLAAILVCFTGVILASAFQRLLLYEEAYGFTQLRTFVHVFMVWVGILLLVYLFTLHVNKPRLFVFALFLAVLGFGATLDILNTDAFIVRQNFNRYLETGKLDAEYLATLSDDAVPGLLAAMYRIAPQERAVLGSALHYRFNTLRELQLTTNWAGWNWSRNRAYRLLSEQQEIFEPFEPRRYDWAFPIE